MKLLYVCDQWPNERFKEDDSMTIAEWWMRAEDSFADRVEEICCERRSTHLNSIHTRAVTVQRKRGRGKHTPTQTHRETHSGGSPMCWWRSEKGRNESQDLKSSLACHELFMRPCRMPGLRALCLRETAGFSYKEQQPTNQHTTRLNTQIQPKNSINWHDAFIYLTAFVKVN